VGLDIYKSRRHHMPGGIDDGSGRRAIDRTRRRDPFDPVSANRDIAVEPGIPGSIDHATIDYQDIGH
jgi:hypothetical protein